MGGRVPFLHESLPALFNQTYPVDIVIVSIARGDPDVVMKELARFGPFTPGLTLPGLPSASSSSSLLNSTAGGAGSGRKLFTGMKGRLVIQFFDKDWGPGTKLVGAYLVIGPSPDTVIIVLDDDCHYSPPHVESLVRHLPADKGAVCGYCEVPLLISPGSWIRTDVLYPRYIVKDVVAECKGWNMGFGGVAYWASSFQDDIVDYLSFLPKGCFYHDDVWLAGYLFKKGVKRYLLYGMVVPRHAAYHVNLSIHSLGNTAHLHQRPCVEHFGNFIER